MKIRSVDGLTGTVGIHITALIIGRHHLRVNVKSASYQKQPKYNYRFESYLFI